MLNSSKGRRIGHSRTLQLGGSGIIRWPLLPLAGVLALALLSLFVVPAPVTEAQTPPAHYDTDGDRLIEISSLAQLNAVRWDLNGNGAADKASDNANYAAAFPVAEDGSVCPAGTDCAGYELTVNLDFDENRDGEITDADAAYWNDGAGWDPIGVAPPQDSWSGARINKGNADTFYSGAFNGNGHTIANLFSKHVETINVGLFAALGNGGEIRDLGVTGVDVTGDSYAAGLAGENYGRITGCYSTGLVTGNYDTGGLVGENWAVMRNVYADVTVKGGKHTGGLVGENEWSGRIIVSYATGMVSGDFDVGGLAGFTESSSSITASYATATVSGNSDVGGLIGENRGNINIGYATGTVTGSSSVGGLVGEHLLGTITHSYFDSQTSGLAVAVGDDDTNQNGVIDAKETATAGVIGQTTAQLQSPTGYTDIYADWNLDLDGDSDLDNPWDFGTGQQYPALKVDLNGDGTATWEEFGYQLRERPALAATPAGTEMQLSWTPVDASHWVDAPTITYALYRDGEKMNGYDGGTLSYTDTGLTLGQTYSYQVATLLDGVETQRSNRATLEAGYNPDRDALTALYNATSGANWTYNKNWLSAEPLGKWGGVTTNDEGRVIALELPNNNLQGSLPEEISDLSELQVLMIRENRGLSGPLPLSMTGMSSMTHLYTVYTQVCAPDDAAIQEWLDGLTKVQIYDCPDDRDRPVLMEFYNATNGPNWTSSNNWGSDKPLHEWAGVTTNHLGRVTRLTLHQRNLNGTIPESFGNLTELRQLYLYDNDLKGPLPTSMGNLTELWIATLGGNEFTGPLPDGLGNLTNLERLELQNNQLTGPLPASLGNLKKLEVLYLHRQVDADGNGGLTGSIPASMGSMTSLQDLALDRNNLSGSIPAELGNLSNLRRLAANRNQLTGAIPAELGSLSNLSVIGLARNQLSGALPTSLGNLSGLTKLSLHDNTGLSGALPSGFTGLVNLERLAVANTGLCAPDDEGFSAWLDGVADKPGGVATCGSP